MRFAIPFAMLLSLALGADTYTGPRPPKPDIPYLVHASNLVPTEAAQAREEQQKKDETTYVIDGASSSARTPLSEPIFLIETDKVSPDHLELFGLEVKNGHREITISQKRRKESPRQYRTLVTRVAERLYRIEASEMLEPGQYSLSPSDSNQAFCFEVY